MGEQPEQLLETPTYDGIAIRPLYTALDELPEPPLPGEWPYVRGGDALRDITPAGRSPKLSLAIRHPTATARCCPRSPRGSARC